MTAQDNIDFARQAYDAMAAADVDWMLAHMHPEVVFVQGGRFPTAGTYRGPDAVLGHFLEFMTLVEGNFSMTPHDFLGSDERVAAVITVTIGLGGRQLDFDEMHVFKIVDGLLVEMHAVPFNPYEVDEFFASAAQTNAAAG